MAKRFGMIVVALVLASAAVETGASLMATGEFGLASPAQAIVGRPLTPISVAGVARRTTRRCAVGVYYC